MSNRCPEIYISVGSNIAPEENIASALELLAEATDLLATSSFYRTRPLLSRKQAEYLNGVWQIETKLGPRGLKENVLAVIEKKLGRKRSEDAYASRRIDLDLILYGDKVCQETGLVLPDPDIYTRNFIAIPLRQLNPQLIMPDTGKGISEVAESLDHGNMRINEEFTTRLANMLDFARVI